MSKILKNQTASIIELDTGDSIPASGQLTINTTDYLLYGDSDNVVTHVGSGDVIVNDGSTDLSISDGIDLIKGIFPTSIEIIGPSGSKVSVDDNGHIDVVSHSHPEGGIIHFVSGDVTSNTDFILLDISDTTNYPHLYTGAAHVGWITFETDTSSSANYHLQFGFIDNVDGTNGDFHEIHRISATQKDGLSGQYFFPMNPEGIFCKAGKYLSSVNSLNDTSFNTATNMRSTINPSTANVKPGNNDLIMRIIVNQGTVNLAFDFNYHSHS